MAHSTGGIGYFAVVCCCLLLLGKFEGTTSLCNSFARGSPPGNPDHGKECNDLIMDFEEKAFLAVDTPNGQIQVLEPGTHHALMSGNVVVAVTSLQPRSLLQPQYSNAGAAYYVKEGVGKVGLAEGASVEEIDLQRGDVFVVRQGQVWYLLNHDPTRTLQVFSVSQPRRKAVPSTYQPHFLLGAEQNSGVLNGFSDAVLSQAFKAEAGMISTIVREVEAPPIAPIPEGSPWAKAEPDRNSLSFLQYLFRGKLREEHGMTYNMEMEHHHDVENRGGWSTVADLSKFPRLLQVNLSAFEARLFPGALLAPHFNPDATEIALITHGQGFVEIVAADGSVVAKQRVQRGSVVVVPRSYAVAQLAAKDSSLEFAGFATNSAPPRVAFLAGTQSVLHTLGPQVLAAASGVDLQVVIKFLKDQDESVIISANNTSAEQMPRIYLQTYPGDVM